MDLLKAGCQYDLTSSTGTEGVTVVHVKLTDTALKVIEEYHEWSRSSKTQQSTIQLKDSHSGVIQVPVKQSTESRCFTFTLSGIGQQTEQKDGSLECIQQTLSSREKCLRSVGVMSHKLQVQATDDVYKSTLVKMSQVEEQSKMARAKEIKHSGPNIGRKVKKSFVLRRSLPLLSTATKPANLTSAVSKTPTGTGRQTTDTSTAKPAAQGIVAGTSRQAMDASTKPAVQGIIARPPPEQSSTVVNRKSAPPVIVNCSKSSTAATTEFSLRDRVIHLLALRPYKKPELILRLQKDGVKTDQSSLHKVLESVAENRRDAFTLYRHLYVTDVKQHWPLYTSDDQQALARKLQSLQEVSVADSPALSPCASVGSRGSPAPHPTHKRAPSAAAATLSTTNKRQKLMNVKLESTSVVSNGMATATARRRSSTQSVDATLREKLLKNSDYDDYTSQYKSIKSDAERLRYKRDFTTQYDEYLRLREKTIERLKLATDLSVSLQSHSEGSTEYEKLKQKLYAEYSRLKADQSYCDDRRLWSYLHRKLEHIKHCVHNYDTQNITAAS